MRQGETQIVMLSHKLFLRETVRISTNRQAFRKFHSNRELLLFELHLVTRNDPKNLCTAEQTQFRFMVHTYRDSYGLGLAHEGHNCAPGSVEEI